MTLQEEISRSENHTLECKVEHLSDTIPHGANKNRTYSVKDLINGKINFSKFFEDKRKS